MFLSPSNLLTLKIECIPNSNDDHFYKYLNSAAGKRLTTVVSIYLLFVTRGKLLLLWRLRWQGTKQKMNVQNGRKTFNTLSEPLTYHPLSSWGKICKKAWKYELRNNPLGYYPNITSSCSKMYLGSAKNTI